MENMLLVNKINEGITSVSSTDKYFLYIVDKEGNKLGTISVESLFNQLRSYDILKKYFNKE